MLTTAAIDDFYRYLLVAKSNLNTPYLGVVKSLANSYKLYLISTTHSEITFSKNQANKVIDQIKFLQNNHFFPTDIQTTLSDIIHDLTTMGQEFLKLFPERQEAENYCDDIDNLYNNPFATNNSQDVTMLQLDVGLSRDEKLSVSTTQDRTFDGEANIEQLAEMRDDKSSPETNINTQQQLINQNTLLSYQYLHLTKEEDFPTSEDDLLELLLAAFNNLEQKQDPTDEEKTIRNHFLNHIYHIYARNLTKERLTHSYTAGAKTGETLLPYVDKLIEAATSEEVKSKLTESKFRLLKNINFCTRGFLRTNKLAEAFHYNQLLMHQFEYMPPKIINAVIKTHEYLAKEFIDRGRLIAFDKKFQQALQFAKCAMTANDDLSKNSFTNPNDVTDYVAKKYFAQVMAAYCTYKMNQAFIEQKPYAVFETYINLLVEVQGIPDKNFDLIIEERMEGYLEQLLKNLLKSDYQKTILACEYALKSLTPLPRYTQEADDVLDMIRLYLIQASLIAADQAYEEKSNQACTSYLSNVHEISKELNINKASIIFPEIFQSIDFNFERIAKNLGQLNQSLANQATPQSLLFTSNPTQSTITNTTNITNATNITNTTNTVTNDNSNNNTLPPNKRHKH